MSVSLDTALSSLNIDIEDLEGLTADEIEAKITEALPDGLSADELTELKTDILTELSALEEEWEDILDGEEDDYDDSETEEGKARAERNMDEVNESLDLLATFEDALDEPFEHQLLLNYETSTEMTWTTSGLNDGDAVTIKATGTQANAESMWGEDETEETEVTAGEDGVVTYADYEAQQVADATATADTAQMLILGAAGETFTLAEDGADYTVFNVTDADGNTYTLRIEGKPAIYFEPGTVSLDAISGYSDDLAKRCYEYGDTMSFYDHQNTDEMSDAEKLAYVETYTDVVNSTTFDTAWAQVSEWIGIENISYDENGAITETAYNTGTSLTSDEAYDYYKSALDQLYAWFNEGSDKESIEGVWSNIFAEWSSAGLSDNDITAIIETMVLGLFNGGNETMFQAIMGPAIGTLESYIETDGDSTNPMNEFDKMITLLLETKSGGVGRYGGADIWTNTTMTKATTDVDGNTTYSEAEWIDNAENIAAIEMYKTAVFGSWTVTGAYEDVQIAIEEGKLAADAAIAEEGGGKTVEIDEDDVSALKKAAHDNIDQAYLTYSDTVERAMYEIFDDILSKSPIDVEELRDAITLKIENHTPQDERDDLASILIWTLHQEVPDLLTTLSEDGDWTDLIWDHINNEIDPAFADLIMRDVWTDKKTGGGLA